MSQVWLHGRNLLHKLPVRALIAGVFAALVGLAAGRTFIGSVSVVDGMSMSPNFEPGARVYTIPISSTVERGDVVVVDDGKADYAMKRVIGLPGETVQLYRGHVFINRRLLSEPYLPKHTYTYATADQSTFVLDENHFFVLGDNRPRSADSRVYGPLNREEIKRRVMTENNLRPEIRPYTLPAPGNTLIRPI